ncbi:MAG: ATP-binding protein [Hyphomicrobiaceae bacterium]|nr:ATP-binding protein [Hyphomicrobiaceae bacterium]
MDPVRNPFAPGAGTPPPELAGRRAIITQAEIVLARAAQRRHAKSFLVIGLRGVGKTVLLNRIEELARDGGHEVVSIEAREGRPLPELLAQPLRRALLGLDRRGAADHIVRRGLAILRSFIGNIKVKHGDVEIGLDIEPETGVADSGDLERDLTEMLVALGEAAVARATVVCLLIDELQYVKESELGALIMGLHRVAQLRLPVVFAGAGLPQLVGQMGDSKSYAERLFDFPAVGALSPADAELAIRQPIENEGEKIDAGAVANILQRSQGYPYFLQVWGYETWNAADRSPIRSRDVDAAEDAVLANLDQSFFRVRFDRLTPVEKAYLRVMSELGPGPHRSGEIADALKVKVQKAAPTRASLIRKGMIYSPDHGDTAFTVPMFDAFMKRQMPDLPSP